VIKDKQNAYVFPVAKNK